MDLSSLTSEIENLVIAGAGQSFNGHDFRDLLRPGVYVLLSANDVLYVGLGNRLLRRIGSKHHKNELFEICSEVRVFPCKSLDAAKRLEKILISRLNPAYNVNARDAFITKMLGIRQLRINQSATP
jgi:excinuclease UvrABC nuclease subunit